MAQHRPTEIKAVTALLEAEHDDVDSMAIALLDLLLDIKWSRGSYVAIQRRHQPTEHGWPDFLAWGPYPTRKQAELDIGRRITGTAQHRAGCKQRPLCQGCADVLDTAYFALVQDLDALTTPDPELWLFDYTEGATP